VIAGSDPALVLEAACAGQGVMLAMDMSMEAEVKAGRLCRALPRWAGPPQELNALYPQECVRWPKVRALVRYLQERSDPSPKQYRELASELLTRRP
jgi:DNA-binding transcriptional LysR family regulator